MDFKNIPIKYRPIPFWSWNEKLDTEETKEQVKKMHIAGIGGFFMHARGGLQTEYMGEEWFDNAAAAIDAAKKYGMRPWAYDENGWPSGFCDGKVNGLGIKYQQKYLRMEQTPEHSETAICKCGNNYFYYEINPFYVDNLDKNVVSEFIKEAYEPYYLKFGNSIEGFFTDEPQVSRNGLPWSFVFEDEYLKRYNQKITEHLEELFLPVGDYKSTRIKFWKMVTDLFSDAYFKQIYDWCESRGLKFTGHLINETHLCYQTFGDGACMPHYEYFHIPGMDWLGRDIFDNLVTYQLGSAAEQLGKKYVLSETFAMCGHNVSFDELKGIYEWQLVHGINLLCQHLEGYSIRGLRKRDYPPAMYYQQPWWDEYYAFNDAMSRIGMILAEGKKTADVLVMHPQTTAWTLYNGYNFDEVDVLDKKFLSVIKDLEKKHISFHLGDETLMERHGKVENGKLVIGKQKYSYVITDCCEFFMDNTSELLEKFKNSGGKIVSYKDLVANAIINNCNITYKKCEYDDFNIHYFVNSSENTESATFQLTGKSLDIYSGDTQAFTGSHTFEPWGSLMVVEDKNHAEPHAGQKEITYIKLPDTLKVASPVENSITLDFCDYYFDGELQEKNGYVLNICERANKLERKVRIHQDYHIKAEYIPDTVYLACETPEIFDIFINNSAIDKTYCGYFLDKSIKKIDISKYLKKGDNTITMECDFEQSSNFYESLKKAYKFESERNKLAYDMEIEAIYIIGDFCVKTDGKWSALEKNASRYSGEFIITAPKNQISAKHIEQQGYPFFCGSLELEGEIDINSANPVLLFDKKGINVIIAEVNGCKKTLISGNTLDLGVFDSPQKAKIKVTLINNLRNLLGPHHTKEGECRNVRPASFLKEHCVWNASFKPEWDNDYCFVEMSI